MSPRDEHLAEAGLQAEQQRPIHFAGGVLVRGPVARTIDDAQDLAGVGQRDDQRMVTPDAVVGDVHPVLAPAGGLGQGAVEVDGGAGKEVVGLLGPDAPPRVVEGVDQRFDVAVREASAEVAGRGRVGDATGAQGIQKVLVVTAQFDVLQTGALAQGVVGEVEHVVGFVVGQVQLEQLQVSIDGVDQADAPGQQMDGPDAAAGDGPGFGRHLVMNVAGRELRLVGDRIARLVEPAFDSVLAIAEPATENGLHLKSFRGRGAWECRYFLKHRRTPKDFRFFQPADAKCRATLACSRSSHAVGDFSWNREADVSRCIHRCAFIAPFTLVLYLN